MPIEYANASKLYNADMCQELGITVPEGYTALEAEALPEKTGIVKRKET